MGSIVTNRLRIIVAGLVARFPVGGVAWDYLQYAIGLHRMGHDVYYFEDTRAWPYDPVRQTITGDPGYSAAFLDHFFARYEPALRDRWHYVHLARESAGMPAKQFAKIAASADLFINVSGGCFFPSAMTSRTRRVFIDTDPGFNQILYLTRPTWSPNVEQWAQMVDAHDVYLSYAENIGHSSCLVPATGHDWLPTRMPIVLDLWRPRTHRSAAWGTVMTWNDFRGRLAYNGIEYGSKDAAFRRLMALPSEVDVPLVVAVGGERTPCDDLAAAGWVALAGPRLSRTPQGYARFIANSRGEISAAKEVYVALRTGWFSCRTACYLASGVPAVVQDTGFSRLISTTAGLIPFDDALEAAAGIRAVESDYRRHADAARGLAEEHFDARTVLADLLAKSTGGLGLARTSVGAG